MKMAYADGGERREIGIQTRQKLRPNVLATSRIVTPFRTLRKRIFDSAIAFGAPFVASEQFFAPMAPWKHAPGSHRSSLSNQ